MAMSKAPLPQERQENRIIVPAEPGMKRCFEAPPLGAAELQHVTVSTVLAVQYLSGDATQYY